MIRDDDAGDATRAEPVVLTLPIAPSPTHSRMGWESQPVPQTPRGFPIAKTAMVGSVLAASVAMWLVIEHGDEPDGEIAARTGQAGPAPSVAPQPFTAAPRSAAPISHAALPGVPEVVASGMSAPAPPSVEREAPQPVSRKSRLTSGAGSRAAAREAAMAKTDRASRIAAVSGDAAARGGDGTADTEPHRAPPPPHSFAPTVVATGPAMPFAATAPASPIVTAAALDANRLSGERKIVPDEITLGAIGRAGGDMLISSFKICVASDGNISSITQLRGTGFPAYDAKIQSTIRRDWRYRPFVVNGEPTAVCSTVRFVYAQR